MYLNLNATSTPASEIHTNVIYDLGRISAEFCQGRIYFFCFATVIPGSDLLFTICSAVPPLCHAAVGPYNNFEDIKWILGIHKEFSSFPKNLRMRMSQSLFWESDPSFPRL